MERLIEMKRQFAGLVKELREEQAKEAPEKAKAERLAEEIRALAGQIETEEAILRMEEGRDGSEKPAFRAGDDEKAGSRAGKEYRAAFEKYLRTNDTAELRSMAVGTLTKGGYLVPESWEAAIVQKKHELFVMRSLADVQTSALDKNIPVEGAEGVSTWLDEEAAYQESDEEFALKVMEAFKFGRILKASEEILEDETYNLMAYLVTKFARSNGRLEESAFIAGDGVKKPRGFLLDADVGKSTAVNTGFTYDEILDLWASLKSGYAASSSWLMKRTTLIEVMKLKDGDGRYLYQPSTLPGQLGAILDRPVRLADDMPAVAANSKPIAFGDFSYYRIQDRTGFFMQRLNELYAGTGQVGFRGYQRTDGKLLVSEAVKVLRVIA